MLGIGLLYLLTPQICSLAGSNVAAKRCKSATSSTSSSHSPSPRFLSRPHSRPDFFAAPRAQATRRQVSVWCMAMVATVAGSAGRMPAKVLKRAPVKVLVESWPMEFASTVSKSEDMAKPCAPGNLRVTSRAAQTVGYVVPLWLNARAMAPGARRKSCGAMVKFRGSMFPWLCCNMPKIQFELMAMTLSFGKMRFKSAANCCPTQRLFSTPNTSTSTLSSRFASNKPRKQPANLRPLR